MRRRTWVILVVAAIVLGGAAYAWAQSQRQPSNLAAQPTPTQPGPGFGPHGWHHPRGGGWGPGLGGRWGLGRAVHAEMIVPGQGGGFENLTVDRGTAKSVTNNKITIARPDGKEVTKTITANTRYRGVNLPSDVRANEQVMVLSKGDEALLVRQCRYGPGAGTGNNPASTGVPGV